MRKLDYALVLLGAAVMSPILAAILPVVAAILVTPLMDGCGISYQCNR